MNKNSMNKLLQRIKGIPKSILIPLAAIFAFFVISNIIYEDINRAMALFGRFLLFLIAIFIIRMLIKKRDQIKAIYDSKPIELKPDDLQADKMLSENSLSNPNEEDAIDESKTACTMPQNDDNIVEEESLPSDPNVTLETVLSQLNERAAAYLSTEYLPNKYNNPDSDDEDYETHFIEEYKPRAPDHFAHYGKFGNDEIEYIKDSKLVSIFTKKWRDRCMDQFVVIDFETTGLSYVFDRIIEIAAIRYENCIEKDSFISLVNPLMDIPTEATAIHHITDDMVRDAPCERYLIPQLIEYLSESLIVGHNVSFDLNFLEVAAQRYGYNVKYNYIDTLSLSKKLFPGLPNYKLSTIAEYLNMNTSALHRAEHDVAVCTEIIKIALDTLS